MTKKSDVLTHLTRDELLSAADRLGVELPERRAKDPIVEALTASKKARLADVLAYLKRDRLKELCRTLGLDDSGRVKDEIIARLASVPTSTPAPATTGAPAQTSLGFDPPPRPDPLSTSARKASASGAADSVATYASSGRSPTPAKALGSFSEIASFLWSVADLLRGDYRQSEYGKVILPFTVLRRLDCVLEGTKQAVLAEKAQREKAGLNPEPFLLAKAGQRFVNTDALDLRKLIGDQDHIGENLRRYIQGFSAPVREIFERFEFHTQIERLEKAKLLYLVTEKFANVDLHPDVVTNAQMGLVFEELIRKFAELSNETAGEHFTPREVIRLMVNLLFIEDDDALTKPGVVRSLYDPTAGTGGMLSVAEEHLAQLNPEARLVLHGQELNPESYAICKADMLIKGQDIANVIFGNTLSDDGMEGKRFDYMLSNPPFGVEWKKIERAVRKEAVEKGFAGRFGPGLPRVSDGSLLFLLHLVSKMRPAVDGGSRFAIVLNGSPLFTGSAGSGESEIRRYLLENDLVEAIIGLPTDMFYNTGISTYVWVLSNRKPAPRKGKVQLIDGSSFFQKMRKSLGSKRKELSEAHIDDLTRLFGEFREETRDGVPISRIFPNDAFGYRTVTVERPERDAQGRVVLGQKGKGSGKPVPDASLRDTENVPLTEDVEAYFEREVRPHAPDAWIDHEKTKIGYEIPFNRHFYVFKPPRSLAEIDADLKQVTDRILEMLGGLSR